MISLVIEGTWENGKFKPREPINLPEGARVRLTITPVDEDGDPLHAVMGICDGPADGAKNHDKYIYGSLRS